MERRRGSVLLSFSVAVPPAASRESLKELEVGETNASPELIPVIPKYLNVVCLHWLLAALDLDLQHDSPTKKRYHLLQISYLLPPDLLSFHQLRPLVRFAAAQLLLLHRRKINDGPNQFK